MKTCPALWLAALLCTGLTFPLHAQGTAFTYQGRLSDGAAAATGAYDLRFVIYDASSGGNQHGPVLTNSSVAVSDGLFTVALDFGASVFTGAERWLEIGVRTNGGTTFSLLSPRQPLTPTPYAIKASVSSALSGGLSSSNLGGTYGNALALTNAANQLAGTFSGNGESVTNISMVSLVNDVAPIIAWGRNGSGESTVPVDVDSAIALAGGTVFSLALRPNGTVTAWGALLQNQSNVLASLANVTAIAAGGHALALRNNGTVVAWGGNTSGQTNVPVGLSSIAAVAAGNSHSLALRSNGTVVAWGLNSSGQATVPAGLNAVAAIAGGASHSLALRSNGTVVAWGLNTSGQTNVPAGLNNVIAIAAGGGHNLALRANGTVVAWGTNTFGQTNVPAGLINVTAIAAGSAHSLARRSDGTLVAWGANHDGQGSVPPRAQDNVHIIAAGSFHNIVLRSGRVAAALASVEENNVFSGANIFTGPATFGDLMASNVSLAGSVSFYGDQFGFSGNAVHFYSPAFFHTTADFEGSVSFRLAGVVFDSATFYGNVGFPDFINGQKLDLKGASYGIGVQTDTLYFRSGNAGGDGFGWYKGGIHTDVARSPGAGGRRLMMLDDAGLQLSALTGAAGLTLSGNRTGDHTTPVAFIENLNTGASAPALRVVGAGSTPGGVLSVSTTGNGLIARFGNSSTWVSELTASGNWSATAFNLTSDRNAKQEFEKVEPREVLEKVAELPISRWSFKQDPATRHLGPMAQDFHAAFGVGPDDKHIATVDADGVALAAIQGLNQKLTEELKRRDLENAELKRELMELKNVVQRLAVQR